MIKANELRIGNWVNEKTSTQCGFLVRQLRLNEDYLEVLFGARNYFDLEPIPLTPEILEKCGFVDIGTGYYGGKKYQIEDYCFDFSGNHVDLCECIEGQYVNSKNIKHLHQLQNLYFALTGSELEIKL